MSASVSDIQVLLNKLIKKSLVTKQTVDSNNDAVGGVNLKGELMVGNGTGPDHLDPSTGIDGYVLTKDDTQPIGIKWAKPPSQGSNNGLLYLTGSTVLLPEQHNHLLVCNGVFTVVLPITTLGAVPIGTRFELVNNCENPADITTFQAGAGSTLVDRQNNSTASVTVGVTNRAFVYYIGNNVWRVHGIYGQ